LAKRGIQHLDREISKMKTTSTKQVFVVTLALVGTLFLSGTGSLEAAAKSSMKATPAPTMLNLDVETRPAEDRARDAGRKPAEVLAFLRIGEGMTVMDIMASGGYYTEVLSIAVGSNGTVYAENPPSFLEWNDGLYGKAIAKRLEGNRLPNVTRLDLAPNETGLENGSLDAALSALNFHDIYNPSPEVAVGLMKAVLVLLKPGGTFGIIDHHGEMGADNTALHRIQMDLVTTTAIEAGFIVEETSDLLMTGEDDHTKMVFDPTVRGKTDRFLLRLKKPE
jgi:predicted methyltransferase